MHNLIAHFTMRVWRKVYTISIYKLADVGISSNLIGSMSLSNVHLKWIICGVILWPASTSVLR